MRKEVPVAITDEMINAHAVEWERWTCRKNKSRPVVVYEVVRTGKPDEPISDETVKVIESWPGDREWAEFRMEHLRTQYSIEAALAAIKHG